MSGGFFRGTSADQDTRFSNKQAKLLKTQKFAPELDHLVDMTKVKMDVMKPWIARRVTELLGFEDEVLINFVYGLLDAKEVDGKQIQIQLTGFMEKNTGKFMRELWGLLLSAQKNASGVPQQFLDEKEEEMRKKKVESDRITQEIQKKKDREGLEPDYAKQKRMDGEADITRRVDAASDDGPKNSVWKDSSANLEEEREIDGRHGSRRTSRHHSTSPHSDNQSPPLQRSAHAKSRSRSFSNSRSYSEDGHKSRSVSVSASPPRRSTSQDQRRRSLAKYSVSPNQRRSPQITRSSSRQKSPYLGRPSSRSLRRSPSPVRRRSPSPVRRRSPSPSPVRRRSPSPVRRRSPPPVRRRSPSPVRRRSPPPVRRRSPSPVRRRSPSPVFRRSPIRVRRRSPSSPFRHSPPLRRRSPTSLRRRSPAPHRRSPSPPRRRSPARPRYQSPQRRYRRSPLPSWHRSPLRRRSPVKLRRRSPSPAREISPQQRSQSPVRRRSPSPFRRSPLPRSPARQRKSSLHYAVDLRSSPRQRNRMQTSQRSRSPQNHGTLSMEHANHGDGVESERNRRSPVHSLKRDENENADFGRSRVDSPSEQWQHVRSETNAKKPHSFSYERDTNKSGNSRSLSRSPARQSRGRKDLYNSLEASRENPDAREGSYKKTHSSSKRSPYSPTRASGKLSGRTNSGEFSPERVVKESLNVRANQVDVKLKEHHEQRRNVEHSGSRVQQVSQLSEDVEYGPGKVDENFLPDGLDNKRSSRKRQGSSSPDERPRNENHHLKNSYSKEASRTDEKKRLHIEDKSNYAKKSRKQLDESHQVGPADTDPEADEINRSHGNEKISKKSEINEATSEDYDSALDHRKETKRRRKEERRMRKEEKRRRRDEKHRRREERRAQKKSKYVDTVTPPPDYERNNGVANNSDEDAGLRVSKTSDMKETESEQKQLEIDLRIKALESLRAKKAISH